MSEPERRSRVACCRRPSVELVGEVVQWRGEEYTFRDREEKPIV